MQCTHKETGKARRELQDVIKHQGRTIKALESAQKRHEKAQELLRKRDDAYDVSLRQNHTSFITHDIVRRAGKTSSRESEVPGHRVCTDPPRRDVSSQVCS